MWLNGEVGDTPLKVGHMLLILDGGLETLYELHHVQDLLEEYSPWSKLLYRLASLWIGVEDMMLMEALLYLMGQEGGNFLKEECRWTCMLEQGLSDMLGQEWNDKQALG